MCHRGSCHSYDSPIPHATDLKFSPSSASVHLTTVKSSLAKTAQIGRIVEGNVFGLEIPKVVFSNRFRVARMGVSVLSVVLRVARGESGRKIVKLQASEAGWDAEFLILYSHEV